MKDKLLLLNNAFHKSDQHQSMPELGWEISDDDDDENRNQKRGNMKKLNIYLIVSSYFYKQKQIHSRQQE